jgi:hypothetical protein
MGYYYYMIIGLSGAGDMLTISLSIYLIKPPTRQQSTPESENGDLYTAATIDRYT